MEHPTINKNIDNSDDDDDNALSSSSSFIDLAEEQNGKEQDDDVNGSTNMMEDYTAVAAGSSSPTSFKLFELQPKGPNGEWMDVTPKEELLQHELERLKDAFTKCSMQLDSSRLENEC